MADAQDVTGCTALHRAVLSNDLLMCKLLVELGARADIEDLDGLNVVDVCLIHKKAPLTRYFRSLSIYCHLFAQKKD